MSASPEFFKPAAPAFSPAGSGCGGAAQPPLVFGGDDYYCTTPTGNGISYLREPTTCPPAPRKPPPPPPQCRKRLFQSQTQAQPAPPAGAESTSVLPLISLRLDELERLFRPHPPPPTTTDKRRRSSTSANKHSAQRSLN